ncbi:MAG TPA: hypothetical protein VIV11_39660 [Kofleriaceae bacterium]
MAARFLLVVVSALATATHADADGYGVLRFTGGTGLPIEDDTWAQSANNSPKLAAGVGGVFYRNIGAMFTADFTIVRLDDNQDLFAIGTSNEKLRRARLLGNLLYEIPNVAPRLSLCVRAGIGADLTWASYDRFAGGTNYPRSLTHGGLALEVAMAAWWFVGPGFEVGAEFALPISHYASETAPGGATGFRYTSLDLDLMLGVRMTSDH